MSEMPPRIVVLLVTRRSSGVGRRLESVLARVQLGASSRIGIRRVDADEQPGLVQRLGVEEIPSIVMLDDRRPVAVLPGRASFREIEGALSSHTSRAAGSPAQ